MDGERHKQWKRWKVMREFYYLVDPKAELMMLPSMAALDDFERRLEAAIKGLEEYFAVLVAECGKGAA